jgi:hypothetical protein
MSLPSNRLVQNISPSVPLSVLVDPRHDGIPVRIVGQRPGTSTRTIARLRYGIDDPNLQLDLLAFGHAEIFVKLNRFAMNDAVDRSNH